MSIPDLALLLFCLYLQSPLIASQYELEMKFQNPGGEGTIFAVSQDFKVLAIHSNSINVLHIYESENRWGSSSLNRRSYTQKQQIYLDAQVYGKVIITPSNSRIILGAFESGDLQIYTYREQTSLYELESTLKLSVYSSLGQIACDPQTPTIVAVGFRGCVVVVDIEAKEGPNKFNVLQEIKTAEGEIEAVAISQNSLYLAFGGIDLTVQIYSFNSTSQQYEPYANFFENQCVRDLRFVTKIQQKIQRIYLIARFDNKTCVYEYLPALKRFEKTLTVQKMGYLNDMMDTFVETDQAFTVTVFKKSVSNTFDPRQSLFIYRSQDMYFSDLTNDLLVFGIFQIASYKYCSIDFCDSCDVIVHPNTQPEYYCKQCIADFQVKSGKQCMRCEKYPLICKNCSQPNRCSRCTDQHTLAPNKSCIPCGIQFCAICDKEKTCQKCLPKYELRQDKCQQLWSNDFISLIIAGTIIGALFVIILAFCLLHHKKRHIAIREKLAKENKQKKIMSQKVGKNRKVRETMIINTSLKNEDSDCDWEDFEEVVR